MSKAQKTKMIDGVKHYYVPPKKQSKLQKKNNDGNYFRENHLNNEQKVYHKVK